MAGLVKTMGAAEPVRRPGGRRLPPDAVPRWSLHLLGVGIWGVTIEANPLISSAMAGLGVAGGLGAAKGVAIGFGMLLHVRRIHNLVALLTAIYFTVAILPWTALFLTN